MDVLRAPSAILSSHSMISALLWQQTMTDDWSILHSDLAYYPGRIRPIVANFDVWRFLTRRSTFHNDVKMIEFE